MLDFFKKKPFTYYFKKIISNFLIWSNLLVTLITFLTYPVISALYSPESYGAFSYIIAYVGILNIFTNSQFNFSISLSFYENFRINSIVLSSVVSISISFIISFVFLLFNQDIFISLSFFAILLGNAINYNLSLVSSSTKRYKILSIARLIQTIVNLSFQVLLFTMKEGGLISALIISVWVINIYYVYMLWGYYDEYKRYISKKKIRFIIRKHKDLIRYSLPTDLLNAVIGNIPVFIIERFFSLHALGLYSFATKIVSIPNTIFSKAIGEVFRQSARDELRDFKSAKNSYKKYLSMLIGVNILIFVPLALMTDFVFHTFFDAKWADATQITSMLCILYFFKGTFAPISYTYYLFNRQKEDFISHIFFFISLLVLIYIIYIFNLDFYNFIIIFIVFNIHLYLFYGIRSYIFSLNRN